MDKYRILSLDGGGSWSLLEVIALQALYGPKESGHDVLKRFDLVAANGGGAVVLLGMAMNMRLDQIVETFFLDHERRQKIFGSTKNGWIKAAGIIRLETLREILGAFSGHTLGALYGAVRQSVGICPDFLICAFDCDRRRPEFFRSNVGSPSASSTGSWDPTLAEIIHATVTSPRNNFDALARIRGTRLCDGTLARLNNPVLAAVTEARANRRNAEIIQVLSLGACTLQRRKLEHEGESARWSKQTEKQAEFLESIRHSAYNDPPDTDTYIAHVMLEQDLPSAVNRPPIETGSLVRLSPVLRPTIHHAKDTDEGGLTSQSMALLARFNRGAVDQKEIALVRQLGNLWITDRVQNEPIRSNRDFHCEVGHDRFSGARDAWLSHTGEKPVSGVIAA